MCVPGSSQKWKHQSCNWTLGSCKAPTRRQLRHGAWVPFPDMTPKDPERPQKHGLCGAERTEKTPKRMRTGQSGAATGEQPVGGKQAIGQACEAGTSEGATGTARECFMKQATRNPDPTPCGTEQEGYLLSFDEIASDDASYSDVLVDNEADLILSRGDGIFHWQDQPLHDKYVCKKHYGALGRGWAKARPKRKGKKARLPRCNVPSIDGAQDHVETVDGSKRRVSKEESEAVWNVKRTFVPLGTGIYLADIMITRRNEFSSF